MILYVFFFKIHFIFGCTGSSLLHVGFSVVAESEGDSGCGVGFSLRRARAALVAVWASRCRAQTLERPGFSSCSTRASLLHGVCSLLGPGFEPMSPALAG